MLKAVLLNDTRYDFHHGGWIVTHNIINCLRQHDVEVIKTCPVGVNWENQKSIVEAIQESDFVIVNGEGTIHHDQPTGVCLAKVATHCKKIGKPAFLINAVFESNSETTVKHMRDFNIIYVRENRSQKELQTFNLQAEVVPDMTFWADPKLQTVKSFTPTKIGVSDSVFQDKSEQLFKFAEKLHFYFLPIMKPYWFRPNHFRSYGSVLKFYVHKIWGFANSNVSYPILRKKYYQSTNKYLMTLRHLKFLYSGRFHSTCFAIKYGVPFVCIKSNSHKMQGLLEDVGLNQDRLVDVFTNEQSDKFVFTDEEIKCVKKYISNAQQSINAMFDHIVNQLR